MKKHDLRVSFVTAAVFSGILLSGCVGNNEPPAEPEKKSPETAAAAAKETSPAAESEMAFAKGLFTNRDCVRAFEIFRKYAAEGNAEAEAWLGRSYLNGIGTERDFEKAYEYFSKAAARNDPWGINGLGVCAQYGYGRAVDLQAAMSHYKKAADLKHPLGTLNLARTYADKEGGFFDAKLAEEYFRKALELDASGARTLYAAFLCDLKRYKEAVPLLRASLSDPFAMKLMADCYQNGWGVPVDIAKAVDLAEKSFRKAGARRWSGDLCFNAGLEEAQINGMTEQAKRRFKCAADQGHPEAQYWYAGILGDAKDMDGALSYMLKSADADYHSALLDAGKMLVERKDYDQAIKYYMLATRKRESRRAAVLNLSDIYHYKLKTPNAGSVWDVMGASLGIDFCRNELAIKELFTRGDEHLAKAAALFAEGRISDNKFASKWLADILAKDYDRLRSLADRNNPDALLALGLVGCMEEKGHPNIPIGIELLERSAKLGNAVACRILGNLYRNGVLAKKDLKKALSWYRKGAEYGDGESARTAALMLIYYENEFRNTKIEDFKKTFDRALELEEFSVAFEYGQVMEFVGKDLKEAEALYRIAAAHDDPRAMLHLHKMLLKTKERDSFDFLLQAVDADFRDAELLMGDRRLRLKCPREGFIYYLRAYIHGDRVNAPFRLAECWLNGYGCEVNQNCFWRCAEEAYKNGCVEVCYLLGSVFRDGKICPRDPVRAKAYFREGVKRGSKRCKEALAQL